jgi:hypothetical protein
MENWSVSVSTDKEENPIDEVVFQAGAGIAPVNKG